jgi:hypothetical protein
MLSKRPQSNSFLDSLQYPSIDRDQPSFNPEDVFLLPEDVNNFKKPRNVKNTITSTSPMAQSKMPTMTPSPIPTPRPSMPSMEEQQPEQDSTNFLGSLLAQGTAMLGAGIQGGDVGQVGRSFEYGRQRAEQDRKAKALVDPKSEESKRRRMVFQKAMGFSIPEEYSATDLNDPVVLQSIRDKKMQELVPKGGTGIGVRSGGVGQAKPEKESKEQDISDSYTSTADKLQKQLIEYSNAVKSIPIGGGAKEKARAEALASKLLLNIKTAEKTGSLDEGSTMVIERMIGTPDYTRDNVVDARIDQALKIVNDNVEDRLRGSNTKNQYYKPYIPYEASEQEKQIINNYYTNPNDPNYSKLYNDLKTKKGF